MLSKHIRQINSSLFSRKLEKSLITLSVLLLVVTIGAPFGVSEFESAYAAEGDAWCDLGPSVCNTDWENRYEIKIDGVTDERGYVITDDDMKTSVEGLFAAGDVRIKNVRQITTATGDGTVASIKANDYVTSKF